MLEGIKCFGKERGGDSASALRTVEGGCNFKQMVSPHCKGDT